MKVWLLLVLLAIFTFFAFIEELEDLGRGTYDLGAIALVVLLGLPGLAYSLFPMAALIGALLGLGNLLNIKEAAARNINTMHDLIPVAAQLSADHMRWWLAIAESVRRLSQATDKHAVNFAAQKFLMNLGEFDQLSL